MRNVSLEAERVHRPEPTASASRRLRCATPCTCCAAPARASPIGWRGCRRRRRRARRCGARSARRCRAWIASSGWCRPCCSRARRTDTATGRSGFPVLRHGAFWVMRSRTLSVSNSGRGCQSCECGQVSTVAMLACSLVPASCGRQLDGGRAKHQCKL